MPGCHVAHGGMVGHYRCLACDIDPCRIGDGISRCRLGRGHVAWALGYVDVGRRLVPGCHVAHGGMVGHHGRPL